MDLGTLGAIGFMLLCIAATILAVAYNLPDKEPEREMTPRLIPLPEGSTLTPVVNTRDPFLLNSGLQVVEMMVTDISFGNNGPNTMTLSAIDSKTYHERYRSPL